MTNVEARQSEALNEANEALAKADAKILHDLFVESQEKVAALVRGVEVIVGEGIGKPKTTEVHSDMLLKAIEGMKEVALAAIQLAKDIGAKDK